MSQFNSQNDVPRIISQTSGSGGSSGGRVILYRGQQYHESEFRNQFPQQYADLQHAEGGTNAPPIPAGQPGSPYPASLPANSFEAAIQDAKKAMADANAANEHRYQQALANTQNETKLAQNTFSGVGSRIDADNAANATAGAGNLAALNAGYDEAGNQIQQVGTQALNEARRQQASGIAGAGQNAVSRGLFGSTVLDSLRRRAQESGDRNIQGINESIAGLRSGLAERRGSAVSSFGNTLAQQASAGRLRRADSDVAGYQAQDKALTDRRNVIVGRQDNAPNAGEIARLIANHESALASQPDDGGIGGILGSLLGAGLGAAAGGIGTGIGSKLGGLFGSAVTRHKGGWVPGPKKVNRDVVPAKLTPGEYVMSREEVSEAKRGKVPSRIKDDEGGEFGKMKSKWKKRGPKAAK